MLAAGLVTAIVTGIKESIEANERIEAERKALITPTPEPQVEPNAVAPSLLNAIPKTVTLAVDIKLTQPDGSDITVPAGTTFEVVNQRGNRYTLRYQGQEFMAHVSFAK
jgi:hypothetical protein